MAFRLVARGAGPLQNWEFVHIEDDGVCDFEFQAAGPVPGTGLMRFTCRECGDVAVPDMGLRAMKSVLENLGRGGETVAELPTRSGDPIVVTTRAP